MSFIFSCWNYMDAKDKQQDMQKIVDELKELNINIACSFVCDGSSEQLKINQEFILKCQEEKIKVVVYDKRIFYKNYVNKGKEKYEQDVISCLQDYQNCNNIVSYIISDEPDKEGFNQVCECIDIFKHHTSAIPFVNFSWCDYRGTEYGSKENYLQVLTTQGENRLSVISNDRYSCLHAKDYEENFKEIGIDKFFADLNFFKECANRLNVPYLTNLLSVGHWMYRTPSEDDIRWQLSVSYAHGVDGIIWFFLHQHRLAEDYYTYPIDIYGEKTPIFGSLKRLTRYFIDHVVKPLEGYTFKKVWHLDHSYGNTPLFTKEDADIYVYSDHHLHGIVTLFEKNEKKAYLIVNNNQEYPEVFFVNFKDESLNTHIWLAPGGTYIIYL